MKECDFINDNFICANLFTSEQCNNIISLFNSDNITSSSNTDNQCTQINKKNIYSTEKTEWIFQLIEQKVAYINKKYYNFKLVKLSEYAEVFKFQRNDSFNWKKDLGSGKYSTRKISIILFLSDINNYEGGIIKWFNELITIDLNIQNKLFEQNKGKIMIFPSFNPYKMELLTKGEKYFLTTWALGSHFC